jgi:hypothetical protein
MFSPVDIDDVVIGVHTILGRLVPLLPAPLLPLVPTVLPRVSGRQQGLRLKSKHNFFYLSQNQCCESMTVWCGSGSGSADPCL